MQSTPITKVVEMKYAIMMSLVGSIILATSTQAQAQETRLDAKPVHFGLSVGFLPAGGGESTDEVSGQTDTNDYDDEERVWNRWARDVLGHSVPVGWAPASLWSPASKSIPTSQATRTTAPRWTCAAERNYAIPIGTSPLAGHLVGEGGFMVLFPGGDFEDDLNSIDADTNPRLGFSGTLGGGLSYDLSVARLRADLMLEFYTLKLVDEQISVPFAGDQDLKRRANGSRVLVHARRGVLMRWTDSDR